MKGIVFIRSFYKNVGFIINGVNSVTEAPLIVQTKHEARTMSYPFPKIGCFCDHHIITAIHILTL